MTDVATSHVLVEQLVPIVDRISLEAQVEPYIHNIYTCDHSSIFIHVFNLSINAGMYRIQNLHL